MFYLSHRVGSYKTVSDFKQLAELYTLIERRDEWLMNGMTSVHTTASHCVLRDVV